MKKTYSKTVILHPAASHIFKTINSNTSTKLFDSAGHTLLSCTFCQRRYTISQSGSDKTYLDTGIAVNPSGSRKCINADLRGTISFQLGALAVGPDREVDGLYEALRKSALKEAKAFQAKWIQKGKKLTLYKRVKEAVDSGAAFTIKTLITQNNITGDICTWQHMELGGDGEEECKLVLRQINGSDTANFNKSRRWDAAGGMADSVCKLVRRKNKPEIRTDYECAHKAHKKKD